MTGTLTSARFEEIPTGTVKNYLADHVQSGVVAGIYKPGERLNESKLAAQFGVSRIPVREALLQLQEQGLVISRPRCGMFITKLSEEEIQQINGLRIILESEALKLCRANLTKAIEDRLDSLVQQMDKWKKKIDLDACALDIEFHRTIWKGANNPYIEKILNGLVPMLFSHQALAHADEPRQRLWPPNHHKELFDVVRGTSELSAEAAIIKHLRVMCTNPERFTSLALSRSFGF